MSDEWLTRVTLLERAKDPNDKEAWNDFVYYYKSFIEMVVTKMKVNYHDMDDIVQTVLVKLWNIIENYEVDQNRAKFRTWLSRVIKYTVIDYIRKEKTREQFKGKIQNQYSQLDDQLTDLSNNNDIDIMIEREWELHIAGLALKNISSRFSSQAIEAFELSLTGLEINEISQKLAIKENSVYKLLARMKRTMIDEISQIRDKIEVN